MKVLRLPIVILDELGKLLADPNGRGLRLVQELSETNATHEIIRDRLALYGVGKEEVETVVGAVETRRQAARGNPC